MALSKNADHKCLAVLDDNNDVSACLFTQPAGIAGRWLMDRFSSKAAQLD